MKQAIARVVFSEPTAALFAIVATGLAMDLALRVLFALAH